MHTINKDIPFGHEHQNKLKQLQQEYEKESHPNAFAYNGWLALNKVYNCHRDNNGICYNGDGHGGGSSRVRVPSIKRSKKIWKNFYLMFPKYKELLDNCLLGKQHCVISGNTVSVEIPETTHRTFVDNGEVIHMNPVEDTQYILHNNTVKLRIL